MPKVERRFPVGAGDVFLASYLHARASARGPLDAARFAVRTSAEHVEHGRIRGGAREVAR